jgi:hypothetical protein
VAAVTAIVPIRDFLAAQPYFVRGTPLAGIT